MTDDPSDRDGPPVPLAPADRRQVPVPAIDVCHSLIAWIIPQIEKFPRSRRFTLGDRLERELLDVLAILIEAAYRRDRVTLLRSANVRLAVGRHLWRLGMELEVVQFKAHERGAREMTDLGRQIGGWLRASTPSA